MIVLHSNFPHSILLLQNMSKVTNEEITSLFEVCDFFHKSIDGIVGFDMKNYDLILNSHDHNKELISKIETKLQLDELNKIVIVNTFLDEKDFSIKYGYIENDLFIISHSTDSRSNVCVINGLLDSNGQFTNTSQSMGAFKKWIK